MELGEHAMCDSAVTCPHLVLSRQEVVHILSVVVRMSLK